MRLEGLGQLKILIHLIESRTRDLPACSTEPQLTALPRDSNFTLGLILQHGWKGKLEFSKQLVHYDLWGRGRMEPCNLDTIRR
jgi:hypothetical protein